MKTLTITQQPANSIFKNYCLGLDLTNVKSLKHAISFPAKKDFDTFAKNLKANLKNMHGEVLIRYKSGYKIKTTFAALRKKLFS